MTKLDILEVLEEVKEFLQYIDDILNKYDDDDAEILSDDLEEIESWLSVIGLTISRKLNHGLA